MILYPLTFEPALQEYIWGGRNLERLFRRALPPPPAKVAESWEISAHRAGESIVANGPHKGTGLAALTAQLGSALVGRRHDPALPFPLLVKLLDATDRLSLQVHPPDDYARRHEPGEQGKSEMWLALHAEPGAAIIRGVRPGVTVESFRAAALAGQLEPLLNVIPLRAGDFVCVPSGTLHAILGGLVIAEIQQSSNVTYRVYDWGRLGANGQPRPLHLEKALQVSDFSPAEPRLGQPRPEPAPVGVKRWTLCANEHFVVERWHLDSGAKVEGHTDGGSLEIWGRLSGDVVITGGGASVAMASLGFCLLPAALGDYTIAAAHDSTLVRAYLP
jgi:mannose-6-phosphate isomerase